MGVMGHSFQQKESFGGLVSFTEESGQGSGVRQHEPWKRVAANSRTVAANSEKLLSHGLDFSPLVWSLELIPTTNTT